MMTPRQYQRACSVFDEIRELPENERGLPSMPPAG
jgi:hypothetical protein